jgi:hypothetical protein
MKLEREIISHVEARMKADLAKAARSGAFEWDSAETRAEKLAVINHNYDVIERWKNRAISSAQDRTKYSHDASTNTQTYRRSPALQREWDCLGAGNKRGCSWDGRRGQTLRD